MTTMENWLIGGGIILLALVLIFGLPLLGWNIERRRQQEIETMRAESERAHHNHLWEQDLAALEEAARHRRMAQETTEESEPDEETDAPVEWVPGQLGDTQEMEAIEGEITDGLPDLGEQYFREDPLFSHSLPSELDDNLLVATEAFTYLADRLLLTGVGFGTDATFTGWYDFDQEEFADLLDDEGFTDMLDQELADLLSKELVRA